MNKTIKKIIGFSILVAMALSPFALAASMGQWTTALIAYAIVGILVLLICIAMNLIFDE